MGFILKVMGSYGGCVAGEKNNLIYNFETSPMAPMGKRLGQGPERS